MHRYSVIFVILTAIMAIALPTMADSSSFLTLFDLSVQGIDGQPFTSGNIQALVVDPGNEGSIPWVQWPNLNTFTTAYWLNGEERLISQRLSTPDANDDLVWQGKIMPGANEVRQTLNFSWWTTGAMTADYRWFVIIHNIETRRIVWSQTIAGNGLGAFTAPLSYQGYDILVAATPAVPEPSSLIAFGSGFTSLVGIIIRRRR